MPIPINFKGYSAGHLHAMKVAIENRASDLLVISDQSPRLYIVDVAGIGGEDKVASLSIPKEKMLLLVEKPIDGYQRQLLKPVSFTSLVKAIQDADAKPQAPEDKAARVKIDAAADSDPPKIDIGEFILSVFVKMKKEFDSGKCSSAVFRVDVNEERWIVIDFAREVVFSNISSNQLVYFSRIKNRKLAIKQFTDAIPPNVQNAQPLDVFLWTTAAHAIDDGLISDLSFRGKYRLAEWPNVPKLDLDEKLYQIISLWIARDYSIEELLEKFPVLKKEILVLANLAFILAILDEANEGVASTASQASNPTNPIRSIFRLIANKIGKSGDKS